MTVCSLLAWTSSRLKRAVIAAAVLTLTTAAGSAGGVSSDGSIPPAVAVSAGDFAGSKSFAGKGAPAFAGPATSFASGPPVSWLNLSGSVIGSDDRVRIDNTTTFPYGALTYITFKRSPTLLFGCTGWFISKDTVATAGHCVHKGSGGGNGFLDISTFTITPAQNGGYKPYGSCRARRLYTSTQWSTNGDPQYDYGAIKLDCTLGTRTGWFGYYWQPDSLTGKIAAVSGYPCDKPNGTMWTDSGVIEKTTSTQLYYYMDTAGCESGSPVWHKHPRWGTAGIALHTYGNSRFNTGTRITQTVTIDLNTWRSAP